MNIDYRLKFALFLILAAIVFFMFKANNIFENKIVTHQSKSITFKDDTKPIQIGLTDETTYKIKKGDIINISNTIIDKVYQETKLAGSLGSKLLGAGGGGFMLTWCKEGDRNINQEYLKERKISTLKFKMDFEGSKYLYINRNI